MRPTHSRLRSCGLAAICALLLSGAATAQDEAVRAPVANGLDFFRATSTPHDPDEWRRLVSREPLAAAFSERVRFGAEFEVARHPSSAMGLPEVAVKQYQLRATIELMAFPRSLSPYAGIGLGIGATRFDHSVIELAQGPVASDSLNVGIGGVGFVGLRLPLGPNLALFGEGRAAVAAQLGDEAVATGEGRSDLSGLAGLRLRF